MLLQNDEEDINKWFEYFIDVNKYNYKSSQEAFVLKVKNQKKIENDVNPFIKYILGIVLAAYRELDSRIDIVEDKLPALEQVRKAVNQKIGKFTKNEIRELVPAIGKATFYTRSDI